MEKMKITIVVSTDRTQRRLNACIDSIDAQSIPKNLSVETWVKSWKTGPNRGKVLTEVSSNLVLFLDADCFLPDSNYLRRMLETIRDYPNATLIGGTYLDGRHSTYLDRSYNSLCNLWIASGLNGLNDSSNLLGGCLLINRENLNGLDIPTHLDQWGAEDTRFIRDLIEQGALAKLDQRLSVVHCPDNSIEKSIRRAWIHGQRRSQFGLKSNQVGISKNLVPSVNLLKSSIFIAGHLSIVFAGSVAQKAAGLSTRRGDGPNSR